ncbi:MAG: hypothetical protein K0Q79_3571 [Flavipsychrobacter sp.]|jgi:sugar lactone lactonase YvrE|nr:hypothetical protein [Flavipsychrobacter sp.]
MNRILFILIFLPCFAGAQIVTTIAGSGSGMGYSGDGGPATAAVMSRTYGIARDAAGNIYVTDFNNNRIRKIDPSGIITTFAGTGAAAFSGDGGPATAASLHGPVGLAIGGGNLYVCDNINYRIRKIDASGIITTIAGNGSNSYGGDGGPATAAQISRSNGVAVDAAGNVYMTDLDNARIRKIDASGIITTVVGSGITGYSGDGGPATLAQLDWPDDIKFDAAGNLYFCDFHNNAVRKVNTSGIITTIAGTGVAGFSGDGGPATAAQLRGPDGVLPDLYGNVFIGDMANHRVRMITTSGIIITIAGAGTPAFSGDGGPAILAEFNNTNDMVMDPSGNLYICDYSNHRVRRISGLPLSVPEISRSQVILQPNPAIELLTINCPAIINSVTVVNIDGKIVHSGKYNSNEVQVNVGGIPTGIYFVTINGMETREFIKK